MDEWYSAEDFMPHVVCEVELANGEIIQARRVMGDWETLDGEVIYPVRFRSPSVVITRALYRYKYGASATGSASDE